MTGVRVSDPEGLTPTYAGYFVCGGK
jgi:hypothetical protein